jgi:DNA-binding MarR family transcriptional regulator
MGFLFKRHKGGKIPSSATFRITQEGSQKLQEFTGDSKSQVLMCLETKGTSNVDDIAAASGLGKGQVERLVPVLAKGGYIQYVGPHSGDDVE